MKFNTMLIAGFLGVALLVGVAGYFSTALSQEALQNSIGENSISLAVEILDKIDRDIYNRIEEFQLYSIDSLLREAAIQSNQEFEKLDDIQDYIDEKDSEWTSTNTEEITPFMEALIGNNLSECLKEKIDFYEEKYGYKRYAEIFVTNKYGANIAQTGKTSDYRQDDETWWQNAKKDTLYISDVEYDESASVYSTDICIRINDENGTFIGVMKVVFNIQEAINIIEEAKTTIKYETAEFKLFNNKGEVIYDGAGEFAIFENISNEEFFTEIVGSSGYSTKGGGGELFTHARSKGYKDYEGFGWILMIEHETEDIFAPVVQMRNSIFTMSLVLVAVAILLSIFISRSFSKPIKKLTYAIDEVSKGRMDVTIEKSNIYEINKLTESLDRVMTSMKRAIKRLKAEQ